MKSIFRCSFVALLLALAPFALAGSVTVNWIAPTENEDGTPATLSGFEIEYQITTSGPILTLPVTDPAARSKTIDGVDPGAVVVIAMRAIGDDGEKSTLSNIVRLTGAGVVTPTRPRPPIVIDPVLSQLSMTTRRANDGAPVGVRNLTALGPLDWFYIGRSAAGDFDHKQGGSVFTLAPTTIGGGVAEFWQGAPENQAAASWSDGTPTPAAADELDIAYIRAVGTDGAGISLRTGALGSGRKRLVVGHSSFEATYDVLVTLDGGPSVVGRVVVPRGEVHTFETSIDVTPTDTGETLLIELRNAGNIGNVVLQYGTAGESSGG